MILLDTGVLAQALKPLGDPAVMVWLDGQVADTLFLSSITHATMSLAVARLPEGKRKEAFQGAVQDILDFFQGRLLPFDMAAASQYGAIAARALSAGKRLPEGVGYLAATAAAHGFIVATREVELYELLGVAVVNPFGR